MSRDFLVEIGTEELPPKALRSLMDAFAGNLAGAIDEARLAHGEVHAYASPRRLAVLIEGLAGKLGTTIGGSAISAGSGFVVPVM